LVAATKFLVAATKTLFVVPDFVAVTKPFFSVWGCHNRMNLGHSHKKMKLRVQGDTHKNKHHCGYLYFSDRSEQEFHMTITLFL